MQSSDDKSTANGAAEEETDVIVGFLGRFTAMVGLPAEALPMALMRPLSGSEAYGTRKD